MKNLRNFFFRSPVVLAGFFLLVTCFPGFGKAKLSGEASARKVDTLFQTVLSFQAAAITDYTEALKRFAEPEARDRFVEMSRTVWQDLDDGLGWSLFFILSPLSIAGAESETPMIAFYQPWADVYLITQWRKQSDNFKLHDADVISGVLFRIGSEHSKSSLPLWLQVTYFRPVSLALALVSSVSEFEDRFNSALTGPWRSRVPSLENPEMTNLIRLDAGVSLMEHLLHMMAWSVPRTDEDARIPLLRKKTAEFLNLAKDHKLDSFFRTGGQETLPEVKNILTSPEIGRIGSCRVSFALPGKDGAMVFLVPPDRPDFTISLMFRGNNQPVITRVDYIPYKEAYLMITGAFASESGKDGN